MAHKKMVVWILTTFVVLFSAVIVLAIYYIGDSVFDHGYSCDWDGQGIAPVTCKTPWSFAHMSDFMQSMFLLFNVMLPAALNVVMLYYLGTTLKEIADWYDARGHAIAEEYMHRYNKDLVVDKYACLTDYMSDYYPGFLRSSKFWIGYYEFLMWHS